MTNLGARRAFHLFLFSLMAVLVSACSAKQTSTSPVPPRARPLIIAHYMPWYANKAVSGKWGWHWTMNHFNPDHVVDGRPEAASHYRPLIGLYDSSDPDVLEYHTLLMKLAGFDGVAIDWYGLEEYYDYAAIHANSQALIKALEKAHLKFTLVYEDQTVTQLIKGKVFKEEEAVAKGRQVLSWLDDNWFKRPSYLQLEKRPVLMVFGPQYYKDGDWPAMFDGLSAPPAFFTLMFKRGPAIGGFSWPTPQNGEAKSWDELTQFGARSKSWTKKIEVAYPRFKDIYGEVGQHSFPPIEDADGKTFRRTFDQAIASGAPIIQVATWNDWGEGTQIEPSVEFGYRDLETTQSYRRQTDPSFKYTAEDLRLPFRLYNLRKKLKNDANGGGSLNAIARLLYEGKVDEARVLLDRAAQ